MKGASVCEAFRMQSSTLELVDLSSESQGVRALYGIEDDRPSFAMTVCSRFAIPYVEP